MYALRVLPGVVLAHTPAGQTSANAFQKTPPDPTSGDGSAHVWIGKYNLNPAGPGGLNLSAPYQWGPPYGNFVHGRC